MTADVRAAIERIRSIHRRVSPYGQMCFCGWIPKGFRSRFGYDDHLNEKLADALVAVVVQAQADERDAVADHLRSSASWRFNRYGPHDKFGAGLWSAANWIVEDRADALTPTKETT